MKIAQTLGSMAGKRMNQLTNLVIAYNFLAQLFFYFIFFLDPEPLFNFMAISVSFSSSFTIFFFFFGFVLQFRYSLVTRVNSAQFRCALSSNHRSGLCDFPLWRFPREIGEVEQKRRRRRNRNRKNGEGKQPPQSFAH